MNKPWKSCSFTEKYLSFDGRINRKRYIIFRIFTFIPIFLIVQLQNMSIDAMYYGRSPIFYDIIAAGIALIMIPLNFSFIIRRYHDFNKSGWFCILNFIAQAEWVLAFILEIILCAIPSSNGLNKYGESLLTLDDFSSTPSYENKSSVKIEKKKPFLSFFNSLKIKFTKSQQEKKDIYQLYRESCFNEYQIIKRKFTAYDFTLIDKAFYSVFDIQNVRQSVINMIEQEHVNYYLCVFRIINELTFHGLTSGKYIGLSLDWKGHQEITEEGHKIFALYVLSVQEFEKAGIWTSEYANSQIEWMHQELDYLRGATNTRPQRYSEE